MIRDDMRDIVYADKSAREPAAAACTFLGIAHSVLNDSNDEAEAKQSPRRGLSAR